MLINDVYSDCCPGLREGISLRVLLWSWVSGKRSNNCNQRVIYSRFQTGCGISEGILKLETPPCTLQRFLEQGTSLPAPTTPHTDLLNQNRCDL